MRIFLSVLLLTLLCCSSILAEEKKTKSQQLEEVVVTGTREAEPLKEKPQTVGVKKQKEIKDTKPSHPSDIMNRIPGV